MGIKSLPLQGITMLRIVILSAIVFITNTTSCLSETFQSIGSTLDAYFSSSGGVTEAIVKEVNSAKSEMFEPPRGKVIIYI
jgi:hypothetical protein